MDTVVLNNMLNEALIADLGDGLDTVADRLTYLYDGWRRIGADPAEVEFLGSVLADLGWWRGRIDAALDAPSGSH